MNELDNSKVNEEIIVTNFWDALGYFFIFLFLSMFIVALFYFCFVYKSESYCFDYYKKNGYVLNACNKYKTKLEAIDLSKGAK